MKHSTVAICFYSLFFILFNISPSMANTKPTLFVSVAPQKFFVEKLCGDTVNIEVMVAPGASPATYEPRSSQMRELSKASAYLAIGVPFEEAWLTRLGGVNPKMEIVHTDAGINKMAMATEHHEAEEHHDGDGHHEEEVGHQGDGHEAHQHGSLDPHIWLSPTLVKTQLATIKKSLKKILPAQSESIEQNYQLFLAEIDQLDRDIRTILQENEDMQFMVFHPSWGYFAHDYHLQQIPIELEGKTPKAKQLQELIKEAKEHNIKIIFAQPQFSQKNAQVIAREIKGEVLLIDPLAEDWLNNMKNVALKLKSTVQ